MNAFRRLPVLATLCAVPYGTLPTASPQGRGDFLNFEVSQVHPIAVMKVEDREFLFVCNTPNNSVEVYNTATNVFALSAKTGLRPVSLETDPTTGSLFVANHIGDSVTKIEFFLQGTPPNRVLKHRVAWTHDIGDAPLDLALDPQSGWLYVARQTRSSLSVLDSASGVVVRTSAGEAVDLVLTDLGIITRGAQVTLEDFQAELDNAATAVKEPYSIAFAPGTQNLFVLGMQGGGSPDPGQSFDLDVFGQDLSVSGGAHTVQGGFGTTNFNMTFAQSGEMYVVGTRARNDAADRDALNAEPTGFVQTWLFKLENPSPADGANTWMTTSLQGRDLNTGITDKFKALAQCTDVAVFEPPGGPKRIVVSAFGSDRVALVNATNADPSLWVIQSRTPITPVQHEMAGPRALAIKYADASIEGDPGDRIYVANRLDNSVSVIDPGFPASPLTTFALQHDPVPDHVRDGQKFLYGAKFSGEGFVSCASCHIDARSDQLRWNLSSTDPPAAFGADPEVSGLDSADMSTLMSGEFPVDKGHMITQSLQGLLNYEINPMAEEYVTNAPYHWRGDKPDFVDFNEAFTNLMERTDIGPGGEPRGISPANMDRFDEFVNSISYPPNPEQSFDRTLAGTFGDPNAFDGTGALHGLKLFHTFGLIEPPLPGAIEREGGRSCVQCHTLPDGSNNVITELIAQPIESAALRGLIQKEGRLELLPRFQSSGPLTGERGLGHTGATGLTINEFDQIGFEHFFAAEFTDMEPLEDVNAFVRQMDWGIAPSVGRSISFSDATVSAASLSFAILENQVRLANCGLAVYLTSNGQPSGYWYRAGRSGGPLYEEVSTGNQVSNTGLIAMVNSPGDVLILTATPLGSQRRVAALDGNPGPLPIAPSAPSNFDFAGTAPNSFYAPLVFDLAGQTRLVDANWNTAPSTPFPFDWVGQHQMPAIPVPPASLTATRTLQQGVKDATFLWDTSDPVQIRHDAPRRLRFVGEGIVEGAVVSFEIARMSPGSPVWSQLIELPIHPRWVFEGVDTLYWETAVEFDTMQLAILLLGGPDAPGVQEALSGNTSPTFDPTTWNSYDLTITNPGGASATLQDLRMTY